MCRGTGVRDGLVEKLAFEWGPNWTKAAGRVKVTGRASQVGESMCKVFLMW